MKKIFLNLTGILLLLLLFSCNDEVLTENNEHLDENSEHVHKPKFSATYSEVLKTTGFTTNNMMNRGGNFYDDYIESDYEMDTTRIVKTLDEEGNSVAFAIFMKKKDEMESDIFYNLVYGKKVNGWERFLLKYSPIYEESTDSELHWNVEILSNESYSARCSSTMGSISTFNCPAGHTDPSCWDCSGCWNTDIFIINNPCTFLTDFSDNVNGVYSGGSNSTLSSAQLINRMLIHLGTPTLSSQQYAFLQSNSNVAANLRYWFSQNQNLQGANFVKWAVNFFMQNPTVSWTQFESYFVVGNLNGVSMTEYILDLSNPNLVKPTKKFKSHTKINSIYNQIKTASNFKQYLQNFEPTFSVAHLVFDVGTVNIFDAAAETSEPINYHIKITFNENKDWTNIPKIVVANTFMHEIIHAEMFRKLLSISSTPNGNIDWNQVKSLNTQDNFPGLFDYYVRYMNGDTNYQHEAMATHYVNIMVNFLKQIYGNQYSDFDYKTVVWMSSLMNTKAWLLLPQSTRNSYINNWNTKYWLWEI